MRPFAALRATCGASSGVPLELAALRQSRALIRLGFRSSAQTEGVGVQIQFRYAFDSDKLHRVSREFYNCTNLQYIQPQLNPHAPVEGI